MKLSQLCFNDIGFLDSCDRVIRSCASLAVGVPEPCSVGERSARTVTAARPSPASLPLSAVADPSTRRCRRPGRQPPPGTSPFRRPSRSWVVAAVRATLPCGAPRTRAARVTSSPATSPTGPTTAPASTRATAPVWTGTTSQPAPAAAATWACRSRPAPPAGDPATTWAAHRAAEASTRPASTWPRATSAAARSSCTRSRWRLGTARR